MRQFLLLVGGLRALSEAEHDPRLVLDAFLLRSLAVAGYAPALTECAVCGTTEREAAASGGLRAFGLASGGLTCRECRAPGSATPSAATVALMIALLQYDTTGPFMTIGITVAVVHFVAVNILTPKLVGQRVNLNALSVTIAMMFWSWLWGGFGLILAVPITAAIKAGSGTMNIQAQTINIKADSGATVDAGGGTAAVKGSQAKLN